MKQADGALSGDETKRTLWARRIEQWKRSGKTQREFCARQSIAISTFQWWRARLSRSGATSGQALFVPLPVMSATEAVSAIEVELRSGTRMRFEGEAARAAVDRLIARVR
ncbi:MAG: hypothetical protein GEV05_20550 [Betaproteobacteria bacterium]|nr:hypothetical protein [Betaproteobacteria bacterium]